MRVVLLVALAAASGLAQDFRGEIKLKPLVPPLSQPWVKKAFAAKPQAGALKTCSIPLTTVAPRDTDPKMPIKTPTEAIRTLTVTPPAPPCSGKTSR